MKKTLCLFLSLLLIFSAARAETWQEAEGSREEGGVELMLASSYADLALADGAVWQVMDGEVRLWDLKTREQIASLPVSALYTEEEDFLALIPWAGGALLCAAWNSESPECRVELRELLPADGGVTPGRVFDATSSLGFLFDGAARWLEVDLEACAGGLVISALNEEKNYRLYWYAPEQGILSDLGSQPMEAYTALFAEGDHLLLSASAEGRQELYTISLPGGERARRGSVLTGESYTQPVNYAYDQAEGLLYYQLNGMGYRAPVGEEVQPEAFFSPPETAAPLRYGVAADGVYAFLDEEGELLYQDAKAKVTAARLRVLDLTGTDLLEEGLPAFHARHPETLVILSADDQPDTVLGALVSQSADYDAFVLSLGSELYRTLRRRGYLGAFSGSESLRAAAERLPEGIHDAVWQEGELKALPLAVYNASLALNVPALCAVTGRTEEQLPTDWPGFLALLQEVSAAGLPADGSILLYEEGLTGETLRNLFFAWVLEDFMLWLSQDETRLDGAEAALTPALEALEGVGWQNLGQEEGDWSGAEEPVSLVVAAEPEIAVMALDSGVVCWPLSLQPGGERLMTQEVSALVLNPWSHQGEAVFSLAESLLEQMDPVTRMELDTGSREPVENTSFREDVAFLEQMLPLYEEALLQAEDEAEAAELREEQAELQRFLDNYRQNAAWLVSAQSIAAYEALEGQLALSTDAFWSEGAGDSAVLQFLDGQLPAAAFAARLVAALRMARLEDN